MKGRRTRMCPIGTRAGQITVNGTMVVVCNPVTSDPLWIMFMCMMSVGVYIGLVYVGLVERDTENYRIESAVKHSRLPAEFKDGVLSEEVKRCLRTISRDKLSTIIQYSKKRKHENMVEYIKTLKDVQVV